MVLDLGTPAIEQIPVGVRLLDGLLQGIAVRAAGFGIVTLSALAPAVQVLYVVMMYISVCKWREVMLHSTYAHNVFRSDSDEV